MTKTPPYRPLPGRRRAVPAVLLLALLLGSCTANRYYRDGMAEEDRGHLDLAVLAYQKAVELDPRNSRNRIALARGKQKAAQSHYERGKVYRASGQLELAAVELEQAVSLDGSLEAARQELAATKEDLLRRRAEATGGSPVEKAKERTRGAKARPPMLVPSSDKPIDLVFPQETNIKKIYGALAAAAGINIIYDPQLKDDKFTVDLRSVSFQKGLEVVMRQAGHFYKVLDEKTILIAQDTSQNRKEYEDLVIRTFFLSNGDVKDVSAMVRSILDLRRLGTIPQLNAIVIRDTADKIAVAEKIIDVNDKARAEVIVNVELLQVTMSKVIELGTKLSAYSITAGVVGDDGKPVTSLGWDALMSLGKSDLSFSIPTVTFNFIKDNTDADILAKPQLRIAEGEKAQLTIGQRIPIPVTTISTQVAVGGSGVIPVTSFQYQDVGIKIDIEPRVHHNKEVTLKLMVEISQQDGEVQTPGGLAQPIIGTRTITSTIRLKDGETSVLAGLYRNDRVKSKKGIPFLMDLPLVGPLFTNTKDDQKSTDLLLTMTPQIVRAPQITDDDLVPIWVGTENNVSFSGLNVRLESPRATSSPFDAAPDRSAPAAGQKPAAPLPFQQGLPPTDPFRRTTPAAPAPEVPKQGSLRPEGDEASPVAAAAPALRLVAGAPTLSAGREGTLDLSGAAGLSDLNALELTLEWDPAVAEVTGIAPGPWQEQAAPGSIRFDAEPGTGRARIAVSRVGTSFGLPEGVLARLFVRGLSPGATVFRATAGAALSREGGVRPDLEPATLEVAAAAAP
ncbi:MAG: hypothetical protein EDX89_04140 [Acidobacteria bacterium]|nr:MAG: hypothetical protein EDX89_04140 [Acidobacteriota bacterium]